MKRTILVSLLGIFCLQAEEGEDKRATEENEKEKVRGHVFAWPFLPAGKMQPQGGMTKGGEVTLTEGASPLWEALRAPGLNKKEKDRRAILAMQGEHRVSFDFVEVLGVAEGYRPPKPYFSWATEKILVLEDSPEFVSLQHLLVMYFKDQEGNEGPPMVMKHWRQDWTFEDPEVHQFIGDRTWERKRELSSAREVDGTWTHAVFQVDDSPRYESRGKWSHLGGMSTWVATSTRPLPRREFAQRDDYNVLFAEDEITILPNGWVHLQNNHKVLLEGQARPEFLAREIGVNRYEKLTAPDLSAGMETWQKEAPYWEEVRKVWKQVFQERDRFQIRAKVDGKKLWQEHFAYAAKVREQGFDADAGEKHARETIETFLAEVEAKEPKGNY